MRSTPPVLLLAVAVLAVSVACGGGRSGTGDPTDLPDCVDLHDIYALVGPESTGFVTWAEANELAAELGAGHAPYPDVPLDVFGPGEESGTFDSFVELVLEPIAEDRGQDDPEPRLDYQSSPNDAVIIGGVSGAESAFGWVGFAFYQESAEEVRALAVDGGDGCVEPTAETIASGEYAISRPLFIYVNRAMAEREPALAAFVDHYLSDAGLAAVGDAGYVPLGPAALRETRARWEATGLAGRAAPATFDGSIEVSGSSTVEPISARVAEAFRRDHGGVNISVEGPGTGDGFQRFCAGEIDIADASRPITDEEAAECAAEGVELIELQVAVDGLSVITSRRDGDR